MIDSDNDTPVFGQEVSNAAAIANNVTEQKNRKALDSKLNIKFLPLEIIKIDKTNSRKLLIGIDEVKKGPKIIDSNFDSDAQKIYITQLMQLYASTEKASEKVTQHLNLAIFAASIGSPENLDNPITVVQNGAHMDLVAGERRTLAPHILDAEFILSFIKKFNDYDKAFLQYQENSKQEQLNLSEKINSVEKLVNEWEKKFETTMKRDHAISILGLQKTQAGYYLLVVRSDSDDVKQAIKNGVFNTIQQAYDIAKIKDDAERSIALQAFIDNNPLEERKLTVPKKLKQKKVTEPLLNIGARRGHKSVSFQSILFAALKDPLFDSIRSEADEIYQDDDLKTIQSLAEFMVDSLKKETEN